jgi:hypothetical protein
MTESNDHQTPQDPTGSDNADELRWNLIRVGVRLGIGLLVLGGTLALILGAG